jgi:hypothetical protein
MDLDNDGNLDLVYANYQGGVSIFRNDADAGHRIMIDLRGMVSNRFGVGVLVRIESALGIQVRQLSLARGYPDSNPPKHVRVRWPSGAATEYTVPSGASALTLRSKSQ